MTTWNTPLPRPVITKDGKTLKTLSDARAYVISLSELERRRFPWVHVAQCLLGVVSGETDLETLTLQLELAVMLKPLEED